MRCEESYFEWMNRSIDGDLGPQEQAQLDAHLRECADCRALFAALKRMAAETAALEEEPPADLTEKIMARVQAAQPRRTTGKPAKIVRLAVSLGSAAAVLVMAVFAARLVFRGAGAAEPPAASIGTKSFGAVARDEVSSAAPVEGDWGDRSTGEAPAEDAAPEPMPESTALPADDNRLDTNETAATASLEQEPGEGERSGDMDETAMKYALKIEDYRYILLLNQVPEALADQPYESQTDGSRLYTVSNSVAESLVEESLSHTWQDNDAGTSMVIVETGA